MRYNVNKRFNITNYLNKRRYLMANSENLKPMNKRTKSEQREIAKKGGIKSGEKRRERKALKEELLLLLSTGDTQKKLSVALIEKAMSGDVKAFEVIRDTIGEKPTDKQQLTCGVEIQKVFITEEERKAVEKHINDVINEQ